MKEERPFKSRKMKRFDLFCYLVLITATLYFGIRVIVGITAN